MRERGEVTMRRAVRGDAPAMLEIYRPHVERSAVSFELVVPEVADFEARIERVLATHEWLVAEDETGLLGYAYGGPHREREAYRFSTEVSVYLAPRGEGRGIARGLYELLFERLAARGYGNALAGIAVPNPRSVAFHERLGFRLVGIYHRVGYKFGRWHDVGWYERGLRDGPAGELR